MKVAPVMAALAAYPQVTQTLLHTGQHYDANMSDVFFRQLGLPEPDINLDVRSGSHAVQTAQIMMQIEEIVLAKTPDLVVVYGDVNSTVAAALVCAKLGIRVAHVEAGLRSFDRTMPEEINRLLTDQIADLLFTPSSDGDENLIREGVAPEKVHLVGNVMIDTLMRLQPSVQTRWQLGHMQFGDAVVEPGHYILATLHRPSNVDDLDMLSMVMTTLQEISRQVPIVFPVHPRTRQRLHDIGKADRSAQLHLTEPLGYVDFIALQSQARLVITDSGGVQEETTYLGVPCLTLRENTERPVTVTLGTNILVGRDMVRLSMETQRILSGKTDQSQVPPLWDGNSGKRIANIIISGA